MTRLKYIAEYFRVVFYCISNDTAGVKPQALVYIEPLEAIDGAAPISGANNVGTGGITQTFLAGSQVWPMGH
jgi:hypothetical protein